MKAVARIDDYPLRIESTGSPFTTKVLNADGSELRGISSYTLTVDPDNAMNSGLVIRMCPSAVAFTLREKGFTAEVDVEQVVQALREMIKK